MPAVNPTRLRFQIDNLITLFHSPEEFHNRLKDLFGFYANRTLRFGDSAPSKSFTSMYNIPNPVLRQLYLDLDRYIEVEPQTALVLADDLWKDGYLEVQSTAIHILGSVPVDGPEQVLVRIKKWLSPDLDQTLIAQIFSTGAHQLQDLFPKDWESFIESLLNHEDPKYTGLGIRGLSEGLSNPDFKNLPAVFRLISPFIRNPQRSQLNNLRLLVERLVQRSPTETAFFLRQVLSVSESRLTVQLIKQCLPLFPEVIRQELSTALKK